MAKNLNSRVIVVDDESGRPMLWQEDRFVFIPSIDPKSTKSKNGVKCPVYSRFSARRLVKADNENRKKEGCIPSRFRFILITDRK